jgi:uncharacterized glyoxalase superfamily protein PhnB
MTANGPRLCEAVPVLTVADIGAAIRHYRDVLGFAISFEYGDPPFYASVERDGQALHLHAERTGGRGLGQGAVCFFVEDVDALHREFVGSGARIIKPPQDYPYGMRDFDLHDLDGNRLTFGQESQT